MTQTYYHTCEYCGINLDPGERCDCQTAQKALGSVFSVKVEKMPKRTEKPLRRAVRAS